MANPVSEELRTTRRKNKTSALVTCIGVLGAVVMVSLPDRSPLTLFSPGRAPVTAQVGTGAAMLIGIAIVVIHLLNRQGLTETADWLSLGEISPAAVLRANYLYALSFGALVWIVAIPVLLVGYNWVFVPAGRQAVVFVQLGFSIVTMSLVTIGVVLALEDHPFITSLIVWAFLAVRFLLTPGYAPGLNPLLAVLKTLEGSTTPPWGSFGLNLALILAALAGAVYQIHTSSRRNRT